MATNAKQKARAAERYAEAVVELLAPEFPDLTDHQTRMLATGAITDYVAGRNRVLNVLLGDDAPSRWRLRDDRDVPPGRVRVVCVRSSDPVADRAREDRINAALREIA